MKQYEEDYNMSSEKTLENLAKDAIDQEQSKRIAILENDLDHAKRDIEATRLSLSRAKESFAKTHKELHKDYITPMRDKILYISIILSLMSFVMTVGGWHFGSKTFEQVDKQIEASK